MDAPRISSAHEDADHVIDSSDETVDETVGHIIDTIASTETPEGFDVSGLETEQAKKSARAAEQAIREATGHVHRFGFTHLGSEDSATARSLSGGKIAVEETTDPKFQISAIVHEYAHQLDRSVLGTESDWYTMNNAVPGNPLYDALMASPTVQKIKNDEVELLKGDPDRVKFAAMRELFARAFEQYVANRSSNQTLKERLRKLQADPMLGFQQWQDDEFKPIERELDKVLKQPLQEAIHWEEYLHPRGRGGKWVKAMGHARQEVEREQAQVHQEFTGEDFASAMDGFSHAGITAVRMNRTEAKGLYGRVWLDLQKHGGGSVGSATLKLLPPVRGERVAEYEAIHLNESEQNQGFGRAFTDHLFETLRRGGVDRVKIQAVNVGGYAWARRGFVWTQDRKWIQGATLRDAKAEERWDDTVRHVSPERLAELERKIAAGEFTSEAELAAFGIEEPWQDTQGRRTWLGKEVMLGSNWEGELDLSGHAPPPDLLTDEVRAAMRAARLAHEGR
jgi:GNAT superfamily N-acetyltransferase